jgi:hypothetical protein
MRSRLAVLVLASWFSSHASATDLSVFGLPPFGSPFQPPACKIKGYIPAHPKRGVCFWQNGSMSSHFILPKNGGIDVDFPEGQSPAMVYGWVTARIIDGNIEGVSFRTVGSDTTSYTIQQLTQKYGPPSASSKIPVQNAFGARYVGAEANWKLPDVEVTFKTPYLGEVDKGYVVIKSKKASDMDTAYLLKSVSRQRPL